MQMRGNPNDWLLDSASTPANYTMSVAASDCTEAVSKSKFIVP
jgi:hypothetical protein